VLLPEQQAQQPSQGFLNSRCATLEEALLKVSDCGFVGSLSMNLHFGLLGDLH
jgi:hypothetical protein